MANTLQEIKGAIDSLVISLTEITPEGEQPDPYVADAKSFAAQAGYCIDKQIEVSGITVPEGKPVKGGKRDGNKTA